MHKIKDHVSFLMSNSGLLASIELHQHVEPFSLYFDFDASSEKESKWVSRNKIIVYTVW